MKRIAALVVLVLPFYAVPAHASPALAAKNKCMTCHQVDRKMLGPSFKEISAKYKTDKTAANTLAASMLKGSKGKWGKVPMPPQKISPADSQALAKWILTL